VHSVPWQVSHLCIAGSLLVLAAPALIFFVHAQRLRFSPVLFRSARLRRVSTGLGSSHEPGARTQSLFVPRWRFFSRSQAEGAGRFPAWSPRPVRPLFGSLRDPVPAADFSPDVIFASARRVPRATRSRPYLLVGLGTRRLVFSWLAQSSVSSVLVSVLIEMKICRSRSCY
jgi:hypothetical protein